MLRFSLLLFLFVVYCPSVFADQPRYRSSFSSANEKYEARLKDGEWKLVELDSGKELYRFRNAYAERVRFSSMTLFITDDGRSVIAIDDYSEQDFSKNPAILFFLRDGAEVKSYRLNDLMESRFVTVSVSHFRWTDGHPPAKIVDSSVAVTGQDLIRRIFDVVTGEMISKEIDKELANGAVYVFGRVAGLGGDRHEIKVSCVLYGDAVEGSTVQFSSKSRRWEGNGFWESLVIRNGVLVQSTGNHFNICDSGSKK